MKRPPLLIRSRQRGLSIVEVLVSLVIGLVVVGAVLLSYITSGQTNKLQAAYAQMNEDAQVGLQILSRDLQLAGYAQPTSMDPATFQFGRTYSGHAVFGCDTGFVAANTTGAVACAGAGSPAIEVVYEADLSNSVPHSSGVPSDCLGAALTQDTTATPFFYLTHNRYYVSVSTLGRSELHCASKLGNSGGALVDNVETMKIWYGEANPADKRQIVRYVSAANVLDPTFAHVVSVRVCLLMRSAEPVLSAEDPANYFDCDSVAQVSADRFARRAYFTTTALRNKMTF
ncbi:MAG: PilW family protein [Pseudomonadota bacterium]|uniref:PilW family protein n=1 Tax=Polaromonas sp. TaxID=1869339 RepID=UPI0018080DC6|nr:PilW family protein [Polaromonas sp.]MBA3593847.1 PilW family protein [Polaromonas sp.]MDQ3272430.1 PilW family protein [Pseudomonadota bacterium]